MNSEIIDQVMRGKTINFLIGAGASRPLYQSLSLGKNLPTFEEVVTNDKITEQAKIFMYIYFFNNWIKPMVEKKGQSVKEDEEKNVYQNYERLIKCLYNYLLCEGNESPKRINIFTTNYDLLFERTFDDFLLENPLVYFNDGSRGIFKKSVSNANYYLNVSHSGYNDNYKREVPTINLFKMHGSVSWKIEEDNIIVCENNPIIEDIEKTVRELDLEDSEIEKNIKGCKNKDLDKFIEKLNNYVGELSLDSSLITKFYEQYSNIPIINPDKYKFFKTVSEQHYYQLIRSFSYELERKQSVLIVFGFSFADEHLLDIFKRSLLNPELIVLLISYSKTEQEKFKKLFSGLNNIMFLPSNMTDNSEGDFKYLLELLGDYNEK